MYSNYKISTKAYCAAHRNVGNHRRKDVLYYANQSRKPFPV